MSPRPIRRWTTCRATRRSFRKTFLVGPDAVFIDAVAPDDGVNVSQANMTIKSPKTGRAIGAVTIGVAVDKLR